MGAVEDSRRRGCAASGLGCASQPDLDPAESAQVAGSKAVGAGVRVQTAAACCARVLPAESPANAGERGNQIVGANRSVIRARRKMRQPVS
jgi:hypothetical protein